MRIPLIAAATVFTLATSLLVAPAANAAATADYPADGAGAPARATASAPLLEPALGIGLDLAQGQATQVPLSDGEANAHSALVRLSITRAPAPTAIRVAGSAALRVGAEESASTTVLAPIVDGSFEIIADRDASIRVERIATFSAPIDAPGSVHALSEPVLRADTASGLGLPDDGLGAGASTEVGVLGIGGVPEAGVRAAFVTLQTTATAPSRIDFAGQTLQLRDGVTTVTTSVIPDEFGMLPLDIVSGALTGFSVSVLGYVVEPLDNPAALQGEGAFVPQAEPDTRGVEVSTGEASDLEIDAPAGAEKVLALVSGMQADALGVLDLGRSAGGRANGVIVDGSAGAAPQLVLLDPVGSAYAHGSDIAADVTPLGYVLGAPTTNPTDAKITLDSPSTTSADATDTWTVDFAGTWSTPGDVPQRVEVTVDGAPFGSAPAFVDGRWAYTLSLPESGDYEISFTLVARGGSRTSVDWNGTVTVPTADDVVITDDTVVLDTTDIAAYEADLLSFLTDPALVPGDIVVADVSDATPAGVLGRVESVDVIDGLWVVRLSTATLTDVFLQADVDEALPVGGGEPTVREESETVEIVDGEATDGGDPVTASWATVPAEQVDITDGPLDALDDSPIADDENTTPDAEAVGAGTSAAVALLSSPLQVSLNPMALASNAVRGLQFVQAMRATVPAATFEPASIAHVVEAEFTSGKQITVQARAQLKLALKVTIDIEVRWTEGSAWPPKPPLPYPHLNEFKNVLESSASAEATASATVSKKYEWSKEKSFTREFAPISFAVGPVPVVITSEIGITLEASMSIAGTAKIVVETSYTRTQELGFAFKDGSAQLVDPSPQTTVTPPHFTEDSGLSASASATAGPTLSFTAKLWDLAGPQLELSLKAAIDANGSATVGDPFFTAEAELAIVGAFAVKVLVTVPIIDVTVVEATLLEKSKKWTLWKGAFDLKNFVNPGAPAPDPGESDTDYGGDQLTPAPDVLDAIEIVGADATAAYFVEGPPAPDAFAVLSQPIGGFPTEGEDYFAMSTGSLSEITGAPAGSWSGVPSPRSGAVFDATTLRIDLAIPEGTNCLAGLDFRFYSDEYPDYVGSRYNDAFVAEFGKTTWEIDGYDVSAPRNFAFDELGNPVTINAAGPYTINAENAEGLYGGATEMLRASTPVLSGNTSLYLSIFDQGDGVLDSTVLVDRIEFTSVVDPAMQCSAGVAEH
ncbi:choice-of-anchor L domain-containing protein [Microbacterium aquimaris]|uniref:Choice-of-anchor L domain-containing protein n=1 Tax=Microbacterium aquimaris TaxID=459816 RepID=A0ABU5N5A1_9MICO|nr:choice-of-anchor L domain-containing protein [Microbacterium aquimaris]MDZ8161263.1 choice-of-anchor L domain-containing protein [Microbacterium aquimaris]